MQIISLTAIIVPAKDDKLFIEFYQTAAVCFLRSMGWVCRDQFSALQCGQIELVDCIGVGTGSSPTSEGVDVLAIGSNGHVVKAVGEVALELFLFFPCLGKHVKTLDYRGLNLRFRISSPDVELLPDTKSSVVDPRLRS